MDLDDHFEKLKDPDDHFQTSWTQMVPRDKFRDLACNSLIILDKQRQTNPCNLAKQHYAWRAANSKFIIVLY